MTEHDEHDEHEKPEDINEANGWWRIGKSAWQNDSVIYDPDHEIIRDIEANYKQEQQMFRRSHLQDTITALQENPDLQRDFWLALLAILPEDNPQAPQYPSELRALRKWLAEDSE